MTVRRQITIIIASIIVLILLYYFCVMFPEWAIQKRNIILDQQLMVASQRLFAVRNPLPEDILSSSGKPLLSWRVSYILNNDVEYHKMDCNWSGISFVDTTKPWNDKGNLLALSSRPSFYFYPYYLESNGENKTCLLRIKEIHDKIKAGTLREGEEKKAYLVFVDPKYVVPWTKPQDVSWKDLASGKVQLFKMCYGIYYCDTSGAGCRRLGKEPETIEEWREFCGVDD